MKVIDGDISVTLNGKPVEQLYNVRYHTNMSNIHKITVRNKEGIDPNKISTGNGTEVLIDGQPLKGVRTFSYEVTARGIGLVKLEMYGNVEIDNYADLSVVKSEPMDLAKANTTLAGHFLELTPHLREKVANRLGLLPNNYYDIGRIDLAKHVFKNARDNNLLVELWNEVESHHTEGKPLPNPYSGYDQTEISETCILESLTP